MSAGLPLSDHDRWDWLIALRRATGHALSRPSSSGAAPVRAVFVACSALKRKYRDVLRVAALENRNTLVRFLYLHADESVLLRRVGARQAHFMKTGMVPLQLEALERPSAEGDVVEVDGGRGVESVVLEALGAVRRILGGG